jgi:hypothetical protein
MFRSPRGFLIAGVLGAAASSFTANAQTQPATPDSAVVQIQPGAPEIPATATTPLEREVATIRGTFHDRLAELTTRYGQAHDAEAAAVVQHEIAALKMQLEIDLLSIQLRLARERDDATAVTELEQSLTVVRDRLVADTGLASPPAPAGSAAR